MKIGIGNDHSALELKAEIVEFLKEKGHEVVDYGTYTAESCDYPAYGEAVGRAVASGEVEQGILICGTGLGISLAANKVKGVRAAVLRISLAMKATVDETQRLLTLAEKGVLYPKVKRDAAILCCIETKKSLEYTNLFLEEHGEKKLL